MKNNITILIVCFFTAMGLEGFAQNTTPPTFQTLLRWSNNLSYPTVHRELKKQGFVFLEQQEIELGKSYRYQRVTTTHTQTLGVVAKNNTVYLVAFSTTVIDLSNQYGADIEKIAKSIDCPPSDDKNTTAFCYESSKYWIQLLEGRYYGNITSYSITIRRN